MAEINEQLDRISGLPDSLLSLILSYLPTKEAVGTMVLSKRWEGIWTEVPALNFEAINQGDESKSFVDRILILNVAPSLHRFKLGCSLTLYNEFHICSWIMNVMRRDIFEIDLTLKIDSRIERDTLQPVEEVIFVCEKLKVLKLKSWTPPITPPIVHLPNLVTLHFAHISFIEEFSLEYLLSRLPCLEELVIEYCTVKPMFRICSSSLKRLSITLVLCNPLMETLKRKIIIATPSLEYFFIIDAILDLEFDSTPSLVEATIKVDYCFHVYNLSVSNVISLLSQISHVKRLNIAASTSYLNFDFDPPLSFPNLTHLTVSRGFEFMNHSNFWWHLVIQILHHAPNLTSFNYWCKRFIDKWDDKHLPVLPTSVIPTLKVVTIHMFDDVMKSETLLMEYLLKNATLLQMFRINLRGVANAQTTDAIARLSQVSRASSSTFEVSEPVAADCTCPDLNSKKRKISLL